MRYIQTVCILNFLPSYDMWGRKKALLYSKFKWIHLWALAGGRGWPGGEVEDGQPGKGQRGAGQQGQVVVELAPVPLSLIRRYIFQVKILSVDNIQNSHWKAMMSTGSFQECCHMMSEWVWENFCYRDACIKQLCELLSHIRTYSTNSVCQLLHTYETLRDYLSFIITINY